MQVGREVSHKLKELIGEHREHVDAKQTCLHGSDAISCEERKGTAMLLPSFSLAKCARA